MQRNSDLAELPDVSIAGIKLNVVDRVAIYVQWQARWELDRKHQRRRRGEVKCKCKGDEFEEKAFGLSVRGYQDPEFKINYWQLH